MKIKMLKSAPISTFKSLKKRVSPYNEKLVQYNASQLLYELYKIKPHDAYCILGITFEDMYRPKRIKLSQIIQG